ncbi:MAG: glycoside hydrolase family 88 protein [Prevotella sp.]|nr:glycoside hydrolase family 88 protein [Prevotella sp.]
MRSIRTMAFVMAAFVSASSYAATKKKQETFSADSQMEYCVGKVRTALSQLRDGEGKYDYTMMPRNILDGKTWNCRKAKPEEWCSGFWPGVLWMAYKASGDGEIRQAAEGYTKALDFVATRQAYDHDLGFITINSWLKGIEALGDKAPQHYRRTALAAADSLATLYNPKVGTILSWPRHVKDYGGHNTIMDNMINLELLFWASRNGGSRLLHDIAVSHAVTTMKHHFRPDGSCYHVAVYDTLTGDFLRGQTHQGYADYSMWARGQSWAIYGYTMVYKYTRDPLFLAFAQKVTDIYLKRLQETSDDLIPRWDMDDLRPDAPKDASAACVVASALLDLGDFIGGVHGKYYREMAIKMLAQLSTDRYLSQDKNSSFLLHSTGHHPAGSEIDTSIIYADYYYIEGIEKLKD